MTKKVMTVAAIAVVGSMGLSACGGSSSSEKVSSGGKGGTLYYLMSTNAEHLDPQRVYIGRDISNLDRLAYRSLVQYPMSNGTAAAKPVPDLATNTGTETEGGKTWSFTLKDGVTWQDGKDITCADLKYGLSRTFATDVITGGPNYALSYLDVPQKNGLPVYDGPYKKDHQADFDKAVTCSGKTITYHFNKKWPDFNLALASLPAFDPYRQDQDKGNSSNFSVFSDGPYMLQGSYKPGSGGTFVRNPKYKASTDGVRKALPDKIVFTEGLQRDTINSRMIASSGNDAYTVTDARIQPSFMSQATSQAKGRMSQIQSPYVDYLLPNFKKMTNPKVREALLAATPQSAWIDAGGGSNFADPASSIVNPSLVGYSKQTAFTNLTGDVTKAKQLLQQAGVKTPYPIKFTYEQTPTANKQAAALQQAWNKAGFQVTLDPLASAGVYYANIQSPTYGSDVMWGGWGADWPSASTVIPALFDSRVNLTSKSNGQDYGNYSSNAVNSLIDQAANQSDVNAAGEVYKKADAQLAQDVAYIPLEVEKFNIVYGSKVANYTADSASNSYPDLGAIGLK